MGLSSDGLSLYVTGRYIIPENLYSLIKLDAATGETIWTREFTMNSYYLVVDHNDDIIIWGETTDDETPIGKLMKFDSDGVNLWTRNHAKVKAIAVDSLNNIYIGHVPKQNGFGIQMLNSSGVAQKGGAADTGDGYVYGIAITPNDEIFTVGSIIDVGGNWHRICKWTEGEVDLTITVTAILGASLAWFAESIYSDSIGNVIATDSAWIHSFTSALVTNWSEETALTTNACTIDVHNRVHMFGTDYNAELNGTLIYDKDGAIDAYFGPLLNFNVNEYTNNAIMAKEVYIAEYTDQTLKRMVDDTCCFLDDEIDGPWIDPDPPGLEEGDIWFANETFYTWAQATGIFTSLIDDNIFPPGESDEQWERHGYPDTRLGRVPPCGNVNWDAFPGIAGGVGGCPEIFTVSIIGMMDVSDPGQPSPYNGEYLIIRGPGKFGFFFGVQHDAGTRMNFTIATQRTGGNETFEFGTDAFPSAIFKYTDTAAHTGKWTDIASSNLIGTPNAIACGGAASIYPCEIEQWDAETVWEVGTIVAWKGSVYTADNQNQGSEPPSGDWTVI